MTMNSVNEREHIGIVASFKAMTNSSYSCHSCINQRGEKRKIDAKRAYMGCFEIREKPVTMINNVEFYTCPGNFNAPYFTHLYSLYKNYEKYGLDYESTPAKLVDLYNLIDSIKLDWDKAEAKKAEAKSRKRR